MNYKSNSFKIDSVFFWGFFYQEKNIVFYSCQVTQKIKIVNNNNNNKLISLKSCCNINIKQKFYFLINFSFSCLILFSF
jgi:hypothetical protein